MDAAPTSHAARGRIGGLTRVKAPADRIDEARRELKAAVAEDYIRKLVDEAPPLSAEQRARLASLLAPVRKSGGGRRAA